MRKASIIAVIVILLAGCANGGTGSKVASSKRAIDPSGLVPRVHFGTASDRVSIRDVPAVGRNAGWTEANSAAVIVLEGHCDERGSDGMNLELGDRRARRVMGMLIEEGVDPERLIVLSKGEREPLDGGRGPSAWRRNRRVEFTIR